ncbi:isopenicillin N synthase family dioxygenase [Streptacidiphilus jiangxiensis]|uniref:Isopenicillin N synthase n=1 Tax=Streptacidiphilus jiangxiensis TaxID=235985 RepID=A0A1H7FPC5_STRJI|nr:2-oxoglutarate and iron-dependent oxygenase domain-containing protein [Streptacidiphilus jiangxiensis]SEK27067.1 Isopenicillin N synthase [Streptacidiphilus jiangxiensis]
MSVATLSALPVIDLAHVDHEALHRAARDVGFFQLTGHGVSQAEMDELLRVSRAFFALPEADRLALDNRNSPHYRGYTRIGTELTRGTRDWRDQLDIGEELPPHVPGRDEPAYWWLEGPNQWSSALPELRTTALDWIARLSAVADHLLHELLAAIGAPPDFYDDAFAGHPRSHLKLIRYPGRPELRDDQGVGIHKDYGFLTLLLTDGVSGLQVEDPSGEGYIDVPHIPGAFVVNLGELLEVATNGYLKATNHRVVGTPGERYSAPFFYNPRLDARIEPVPFPHAAQATGVTQDPTNPLHAEFGFNELKGWVRAHPEVTSKHHPELL